MEPRLKNEQEYRDRYDRHTVELCRDIERIWDKDDDPETLKEKKLTKKQAESVKAYGKYMRMLFETGERYLRKEETIRKWMEEDQRKDDLYESAQAPEGIRCLTCRNRLNPIWKDLWYGDGKPDRVLFMYDCPNKCMPRRAFFSDGEEYRSSPKLCPKCSTALTHESIDDKIKMVTTYSCPKCRYSETDEYVWSKKVEDEFDPNFATDRDRFCLTPEKGKEFSDMKFQMEQMGKFMDEWKEEEKRREEKLAANPKGYHLEGRGYTCAICHNGTPEGDNWYDKWGIKCLVCQNAIDKGEIPASLAKDKDSWYTKYELERSFNLKVPTLQKWVRNGLIKSRTVSNYGKGVHYELFMIKDNKDFLPPKKLVESRMGKEIKDGKEVESMHPWYHFGDPFVTLKGYKIMEHLRTVPPEEILAREQEKQRKWDEKQARKKLRKTKK